jgi:hypothetical protein
MTLRALVSFYAFGFIAHFLLSSSVRYVLNHRKWSCASFVTLNLTRFCNTQGSHCCWYVTMNNNSAFLKVPGRSNGAAPAGWKSTLSPLSSVPCPLYMIETFLLSDRSVIKRSAIQTTLFGYIVRYPLLDNVIGAESGWVSCEWGPGEMSNLGRK